VTWARLPLHHGTSAILSHDGDDGRRRAMELCLMIEGQEGVTWEQWVALANACERSGIGTLFRSDHYLGFGSGSWGSLDAWSTINALAARTSTLRLGTLVSPATFRHPSVLVKSAVTADHVSGGRVEVGLGAGWFEEEHRVYGFPFPPLDERMDVFAEQLEIVSRQLSGERFDFNGRHYTLEGCEARPVPVQRPRPPILVGGAARRRSIEPAARFADEYNVVAQDPAACRAALSRVEGACRDAGRDPATMRFSLMTQCVVGRDEREANDRLRRLIGDRDPAEWREGDGAAALVGSTEQVLAQLAAHADAGVERVMLQHLLHDDVEMVELVGRELVPAAGKLVVRR
jgi:F420-dependent oxidoreductase-like protein